MIPMNEHNASDGVQLVNTTMKLCLIPQQNKIPNYPLQQVILDYTGKEQLILSWYLPKTATHVYQEPPIMSNVPGTIFVYKFLKYLHISQIYLCYFMYVCVFTQTYVSLCTTCMLATHGVQKMASHPLEQELQIVVRHHARASVYQIKINCIFLF